MHAQVDAPHVAYEGGKGTGHLWVRQHERDEDREVSIGDAGFRPQGPRHQWQWAGWAAGWQWQATTVRRPGRQFLLLVPFNKKWMTEHIPPWPESLTEEFKCTLTTRQRGQPGWPCHRTATDTSCDHHAALSQTQ